MESIGLGWIGMDWAGRHWFGLEVGWRGINEYVINKNHSIGSAL